MLTYALTYVMVWSVLIFMALPVGVRTAQSPAEGHAPGSPDNARLKAKLVAVSLLAAPLAWLAVHLMNAYVFPLREAFMQ